MTFSELVTEFELTSKELNIITTSGVKTEYTLLEMIEKYKIRSRYEIIKKIKEILRNEDSDYNFKVIESVDKIDESSNNYLTERSLLERKFDVILEYSKDSTITCYTSLLGDNMISELRYSLSNFDVKEIIVTPFNFELMKQEMPRFKSKVEYDYLVIFKILILHCLNKKATDLHFMPITVDSEVEYKVQMRRDGIMVDLDLFKFDKLMNSSVIKLVLDKMSHTDVGDLDSIYGSVANASDIFEDGSTEVRISASSALNGFHYVCRIQSKTTTGKLINELGFPDEVNDVLWKVSRKRSGITLVTGAPRTGKNTTAFAVANEMSKSPIKIIDYSSPIEVLMPFTQIDYGDSTDKLVNLTRLAKKQDIDVVFINEIPDKRVAFAVQELANSSMHVITTLHIDRLYHLPHKLFEFYGEDYVNIISQLNVVITQKMFGTICPHCKESQIVEDLEDKDKIDIMLKNGHKIYYKAKGCPKCTVMDGEGYSIGDNRPSVEFLLFDYELKTKMMAAQKPYQMELIMKEALVHEHSLDYYIPLMISKGIYSINTLDYIL